MKNALEEYQSAISEKLKTFLIEKDNLHNYINVYDQGLDKNYFYTKSVSGAGECNLRSAAQKVAAYAKEKRRKLN